MTTTAQQRRPRQQRFARLVTEVLAPSVVIVALALAMSWHATGYSLGWTLLWALVVATFSAGLPMLVIVRGARAGKWDGHHVRNREGRAVPLAVCLGSTVVGMAILLLGGAPEELVAMAVTMVAVLIAAGVVTYWWKISMHAAVAAGGTAMLAGAYGPVALALLLVVALISWSRVAIEDHTTGQVVSGAIMGFLLSAAVYFPLAG